MKKKENSYLFATLTSLLPNNAKKMTTTIFGSAPPAESLLSVQRLHLLHRKRLQNEERGEGFMQRHKGRKAWALFGTLLGGHCG